MKKIIFLLLLVAVVSCAKTIYVPVEIEKKHIEYRDRELRDTVYVRDSTLVVFGRDTVYIYRDRYVYRDRLVMDTVAIRDSIPFPVYVDRIKEIKYIPKVYKLSFWAVLAGVVFIIGRFIWRWKFKR